MTTSLAEWLSDEAKAIAIYESGAGIGLPHGSKLQA